jgi:hypothetical protein
MLQNAAYTAGLTTYIKQYTHDQNLITGIGICGRHAVNQCYNTIIVFLDNIHRPVFI